MQQPVNTQWWSRLRMQVSQVLQCHERGGDKHSQAAQSLQPSTGFAVLTDTICPDPLVLVSHSTVYVKLPTIFNIMKLPRTKWNMYVKLSSLYNSGRTIHNPNQYMRGVTVRTKAIDSKSLIVCGHTFFRIIIVKRVRFSQVTLISAASLLLLSFLNYLLRNMTNHRITGSLESSQRIHTYLFLSLSLSLSLYFLVI